MAAVTYKWAKGERIEQLTETAGTHLAVTADTAVDAAKVAVDAADTALDAAKVATAALEADSTSLDTLEAAVVSALGVLQADGASPTEAHVDDLQTAWDAFKTALDTLQTDIATADGLVDTTVTASQAAQAATNSAVTAANAAIPDHTVEVSVLTGQKPLDVLLGLDAVKKRVATSKVY